MIHIELKITQRISYFQNHSTKENQLLPSMIISYQMSINTSIFTKNLIIHRRKLVYFHWVIQTNMVEGDIIFVDDIEKELFWTNNQLRRVHIVF